MVEMSIPLGAFGSKVMLSLNDEHMDIRNKDMSGRCARMVAAWLSRRTVNDKPLTWIDLSHNPKLAESKSWSALCSAMSKPVDLQKPRLVNVGLTGEALEGMVTAELFGDLVELDLRSNPSYGAHGKRKVALLVPEKIPQLTTLSTYIPWCRRSTDGFRVRFRRRNDEPAQR